MRYMTDKEFSTLMGYVEEGNASHFYDDYQDCLSDIEIDQINLCLYGLGPKNFVSITVTNSPNFGFGLLIRTKAGEAITMSDITSDPDATVYFTTKQKETYIETIRTIAEIEAL